MLVLHFNICRLKHVSRIAFAVNLIHRNARVSVRIVFENELESSINNLLSDTCNTYIYLELLGHVWYAILCVTETVNMVVFFVKSKIPTQKGEHSYKYTEYITKRGNIVWCSQMSKVFRLSKTTLLGTPWSCVLPMWYLDIIYQIIKQILIFNSLTKYVGRSSNLFFMKSTKFPVKNIYL